MANTVDGLVQALNTVGNLDAGSLEKVVCKLSLPEGGLTADQLETLATMLAQAAQDKRGY